LRDGLNREPEEERCGKVRAFKPCPTCFQRLPFSILYRLLDTFLLGNLRLPDILLKPQSHDSSDEPIFSLFVLFQMKGKLLRLTVSAKIFCDKAFNATREHFCGNAKEPLSPCKSTLAAMRKSPEGSDSEDFCLQDERFGALSSRFRPTGMERKRMFVWSELNL
jgi:hypothetical protein